MAIDRIKITEILAIHSSKYEVAILLMEGDEANWSKVSRETLRWYQTTRRVTTQHFVRSTHGNHWSMWLRLHHVQYLPVSEEEHNALFDHVLEDEVLVVVALDHDVGVDDVVDGLLPLGELIVEIGEVVDLFLGDVCVQNLLVHTTPQRWRDASLGVLNQIGLVLLLQ